MATQVKTVDILIADAIKSVGRSADAVQKAAVAILVHAVKHGDYSKANVLEEGVKNTCRATSLVAWFQKFGGLTSSEGAEGFDGWKGKKHIEANLDEAKKKRWDTVTKPANPFSFNFDDELERLLKRANVAAKKLAANAALSNVIVLDSAKLARVRDAANKAA